MPAADQQFLDSLKFLGESVQQFGLGRAIQDANEQVGQIKQSLAGDMEKRRQIQDLAQRAYGSIAAGGGNPAQLAAIQNLMPQTPNTAAQAVIQGTLDGNMAMRDAGTEILDLERNRELERLAASQAFAERQQARSFQQQIGLQNNAMQQADAKMERQEELRRSRPRELPSNLATKINDIDQASDSLNSIAQKLATDEKFASSFGPVRGRIPGWALPAEDAANQAEVRRVAQAFRHQMSGAAFSKSEAAEYRASEISEQDTPDQMKAKIQISQRLYASQRQRQLKNFESLRYDVGNLKDIAPSAAFIPDNPGAAAGIAKPASSMEDLAKQAFTPRKR